jgi:uncharacterized membrane protein HdeD (DUF308 family)
MSAVSLHQVGLEDVKRNRGWYLALGMLLVLLGTVAIGRTYLLTAVSVLFFGYLMIAAGAAQAIHAFWKERGWGGFFVDLLMGLLYVVVGFMIVANPAAGALTLTLMIAMFLILDGVFHVVAALSVRYPNWGWMLLHGVVTLLLGIMIWRQWPLSGVWVIGLFVGIQMILNGWSLVMLGMAVRDLPEEGRASMVPAA